MDGLPCVHSDRWRHVHCRGRDFSKGEKAWATLGASMILEEVIALAVGCAARRESCKAIAW